MKYYHIRESVVVSPVSIFLDSLSRSRSSHPKLLSLNPDENSKFNSDILVYTDVRVCPFMKPKDKDRIQAGEEKLQSSRRLP